MNQLQEKFNKKIVPQMVKEFGYKGAMAVPRPKKVSVNVGISKSRTDANFADQVANDLKIITGQQPVKTKAKKAVSGFKIRQGQEVGVAVTLRGKRMWDFIEKLISASIPRIRDFQGIEEKNFDQQGNLNYAIKEQIVFPEISHDDIQAIFGLQINVNTTARNKEEGVRLLKLLGFPVKK